MNDYTASNGVEVRFVDTSVGQRMVLKDLDPVQTLLPHRKVNIESWLDPRQWEAAAEYFRAKEDERLGRWRWPEDPDYVVYPRADHVAVVNERSGNALQATREQAFVDTGLCRAARAYFDAHPEPKPWHDAKPGEVWVITYRNAEFAVVINENHEFSIPQRGFRAITHPKVTAGRRIWPEVRTNE